MQKNTPNANIIHINFNLSKFKIKVYPFSFTEYVNYFELTDQYTAFDNYMLEGGMSGSYLYKEREDKYDYIKTVLDTLI